MAIEMKRSDLRGIYKWKTTEHDNPHKRHLDAVFLNREEGYEVLYFINCFAHKYETVLTTIQSLQKVERMIHDAPVDFHSRANIAKWIEDNWDDY